MTKILITGFEAFGGMPVNPSQILVESLEKISFETNFELEIVKAILPVDFKKSGQQIIDLISEHQPHLLISTGVDFAKPNIELEQVAHKNRPYLKEALLKLIAPSIVIDELPDNYSSTADLDSILLDIQAEGVRAIVSDDTGMYVCNHVYYLSCLMSEVLTLDMKSFFVHVPYPFPYYLHGQEVVPDYSMKEIQRGFIKILLASIKYHLDGLDELESLEV